MKWTRPDTVPRLSGWSTHVWKTSVSSQTLVRARAWSFELLSDGEITRANKIVGPRRDLFAVAHARLRILLASYCGGLPRDIVFGSEPTGKPYLVSPSQGSVHFSLAHTPGMILIAICRGGPVGIDVQRIPKSSAALRMFPVTSGGLGRHTTARLTKREFFKRWVIQEAIAKASGQGLADPVLALERISSTTTELQNDSSYFVMCVPLTPGFVAALASPQRLTHVRWYVGGYPVRSLA